MDLESRGGFPREGRSISVEQVLSDPESEIVESHRILFVAYFFRAETTGQGIEHGD
jgi:hypothetical protein